MGDLDGLGYDRATVEVTSCASGMGAAIAEKAWPLVLMNSKLDAVVTGTVLYSDRGFAGGFMTGAIDPVMLAAH